MSKKVVFTFGRFSVPTVGHAKLINKVIDYAKSIGAENRIYTSHSFDNDKNPIPYREKVAFLRQLFPKANVIEDKTAISAFQVARELSDQGYEDVTMIVGEDRVGDFENQIRKYVKTKGSPGFDPKKHYNFKSFKVISAGHRDPNATGVEGMSGTKVREFIKAGDFTSFAKAIPTSNISLARKIFMAAKRNLKEDVDILEGCNDPGIFKAVFLAGGPGSGKDYVMRKVLWGYGLVEINSDNAFEFLMRKENLSFLMPDHEKIQRDMVRGRGKNITKEKERLALQGRLGLIINGTADDYHHIETVKRGLENLGYETQMVYVSASNDVSKARNKMRGMLGGREVPEVIRQEKWLLANANAKHLQQLFGADNFHMVDNSLDLQLADPETRKWKEKYFLDIFKRIRAWTRIKPTNAVCQKWLSEATDIPTPSPEKIAKKHGVPLKNIMGQLKKGEKEEKEHTKSKKVAREIARDHLKGDPKYYDKLAKAGINEDFERFMSDE